MNKTSILLSLYLLVLLGAGVHAVVMYPQSPDEMAVHFGGAGRPNGWMTKQAMYGLYAGLLLVESVMFVGLGFLLGVIPVSLINLPHKDVWLKEPHRDHTLRTLREQMMLFGLVTCLFLIAVMTLVIHANLNQPPVLDSATFLVGLIGYLVFTLIWCVGLVSRFRQPPSSPSSSTQRKKHRHAS